MPSNNSSSSYRRRCSDKLFIETRCIFVNRNIRLRYRSNFLIVGPEVKSAKGQIIRLVIHRVSKKNMPLHLRRLNKNCPIAIIFGILITHIIGHRKVVSFFPPHLVCATILPCKTQNTKIHEFHSMQHLTSGKTYLNNFFHTYIISSQVALHLNAVDYKMWGITQQRQCECDLNKRR